MFFQKLMTKSVLKFYGLSDLKGQNLSKNLVVDVINKADNSNRVNIDNLVNILDIYTKEKLTALGKEIMTTNKRGLVILLISPYSPPYLFMEMDFNLHRE